MSHVILTQYAVYACVRRPSVWLYVVAVVVECIVYASITPAQVYDSLLTAQS
jgi:hypothetical protein